MLTRGNLCAGKGGGGGGGGFSCGVSVTACDALVRTANSSGLKPSLPSLYVETSN